MDAACVVLPSKQLHEDVRFFTEDVGFSLISVIPTNQPVQAELTGFGLTIRLDTRYQAQDAGCIVISTQRPGDAKRSPSGTLVVRESSEPQAEHTTRSHLSEICTLRNSPWKPGKAGMQARELIPSRLDGAISATHIRIPNGGPVADRVHYHTANFQMVLCVSGWIKLAYAGQAEPILLTAGDCVTQPPHIRHQVLETSNGLEVIEISLPADFITAIDNDTVLPTPLTDATALYDGQRFCHFTKDNALWQTHRLPGLLCADTGISRASGGQAGAWLLKSTHLQGPYSSSHTADVLFTYVLAGSVRVNRQLLVAGDAFTLPPEQAHRFGDFSADALLLEVSVPGKFDTVL